MDGRPAPLGAPPTYARAVTRVWRRDLRPIVLLFCGISAIWLLFVGIQSFHYTTETGETGTMRLFDIIAGALSFILMGIEVFGLVAAYTQTLRLVKTYSFLSFVAAAVAMGIEVIEIIEHFATKTDQINNCISSNQTVSSPGILSPGDTFASSDIAASCSSIWSQYSWYIFAWLVVVLLWALLTTAIAVAYYHQLSNPANSRMAPSSAYTMNPYQAQDPPFQAPPQYAGSYGAEPPGYTGDDKMAPLQEKGGFPDDPPDHEGYDIEHAGDLADRHHENYSEVTLTQGQSGREREARI